MLTTKVNLPTPEDVGVRGAWDLPVGRNGDVEEEPDATFVGYATTQLSRHVNHDGADYAPQRTKCPACRWSELRLFRVHGAGPQRYLLHHTGGSRVPDEVFLYRYDEAHSAREVIELLTVRPNLDQVNENDMRPRTPFITRPGARLLAMAAGHDDEIQRAYDSRRIQ